MTFQRWAKEFLLRELECEGKIIYHKKGGWYCLTPYGFLLNVRLARQRFGDMSIEYIIMPLIGKITGYTIDSGEIFMGVYRNAEVDYIRVNNLPFDNPYLSIRSKEYETPETEELLGTIIRNFLNPLFRSLTSYEKYLYVGVALAIAGTVIKYVLEDTVDQLLTTGESYRTPIPRGLERYPEDYPWYTFCITEVLYLYAALGRQKEALAYIRGNRIVNIDVLEYGYRAGNYQNDFEERLLKIELENKDIEEAIESGSTEPIQIILNNNYHKNRQILREVLGVELPEEWEQFVFEHKT